MQLCPRVYFQDRLFQNFHSFEVKFLKSTLLFPKPTVQNFERLVKALHKFGVKMPQEAHFILFVQVPKRYAHINQVLRLRAF